MMEYGRLSFPPVKILPSVRIFQKNKNIWEQQSSTLRAWKLNSVVILS